MLITHAHKFIFLMQRKVMVFRLGFSDTCDQTCWLAEACSQLLLLQMKLTWKTLVAGCICLDPPLLPLPLPPPISATSWEVVLMAFSCLASTTLRPQKKIRQHCMKEADTQQHWQAGKWSGL